MIERIERQRRENDPDHPLRFFGDCRNVSPDGHDLTEHGDAIGVFRLFNGTWGTVSNLADPRCLPVCEMCFRVSSVNGLWEAERW